MELTAAQRRIVDHDGGPVRVAGGPGCGKTTALLARYLRLIAEGHRASSVLVVCHDRAAALRFRDAVLPRLAGGFDALPITTWFGVAFDLVIRARGPVRLLTTSEQQALVRRLLAGESPAEWPVFGRFLGREAFAGEVAGALLGLPPGACEELDRFRRRYDAVLQERGELDRAALLTTAAALATPGRYAHVLVDDHDPAMDGLLVAVTGGGTVVSESPLPWPAVDVELTEPFRRPADPVLVTCRHPSTEPEAVARELLAARAEGVAWSRMAVLVSSAQRHGRSITRALSRHGIPVAPGAGLGVAQQGDPAAAAIADMLAWAAGDESAAGRLATSPLSAPDLVALRDELAAQSPTATPAELAFTVWEKGLGHLVAADDASLDAVVAYLDRLDRGDASPEPWRAPAPAGDREAVTVTTIAGAAGREWHTVVLAGCVEGELPRIRGRAPLFDPAPAPLAARRQASLAGERRRFQTACSRATARLVATAAPEPGVLLSRFVEAWARRPERPPAFRGPMPVARRVTENPVEVFPGGELHLSATQLATYVDCPLRYAYQYGLRVKDESGPALALGSLVHEVLAEFLRPERDGERTHDELLALAAERWRDNIARYRPQVEECRRDYYAMLEAWWAAEGATGPPVLAVERSFDIEVGGVRLRGAIDRIDAGAGGEGTRIVDYKTGKKEPRADAMPDDVQLAVYHLAATRDPELAALGPPRQLQLLYVRTMHAYEQPIVAGHAEATEARIAAVAEDIRAERFEPSVDAACRNCHFHRLCPLQREGREVGVG